MQGDSAAAKRSKTTESATAADSYASASITKQHETAYSTADSKGQQSQAEQLADQHPSEHSPRKENRSPNYEPALSYMEQQFGLPDNLACPEQQSIEHDQASPKHDSAPID